MPLSANVCIVLTPLSFMVSVPVRLPVAVGVNVTDIVHEAPGVRLPLVQLFEGDWKSPEAVIPVMVSCAVPRLVTVIDSGALATPCD